MAQKYFERDYCNECLCVHWVEKQGFGRSEKIICHGEKFTIQDSITHYFKSAKNGGKGFYMVAKTKNFEMRRQARDRKLGRTTDAVSMGDGIGMKHLKDIDF